MRVFITGATGYIGSVVAETFRRAGHDVSGMIRSEEKAKALALREIRPVKGTLQKIKELDGVLQESEVLIHCAVEMSKENVALDRGVIDAFLNAAKNSSTTKTVIYTSGVWVCGNTGDKLINESIPTNPIKLVAWRPAHEELVMNAATSRIHTIVIRPACVYGGSGGLTAMWFDSATKEKKIQIVVVHHCLPPT